MWREYPFLVPFLRILLFLRISKNLSLYNLTVAITSSRRAHELAHIVESFGGIPYIVPTIGIMDAGTSKNEIEKFVNTVLNTSLDFFIFMTGPSIHYLFRIASNLNTKDELVTAIRKSIVISRSDKPSAVLRTLGIRTDLLPNDNTAKGILDMLKVKDMKQKRIAIIGNASGSKNLKTELESQGSSVLELPLFTYSSYLDETADTILKEMGYRHEKPKIKSISKLIKDVLNGAVHAITFTSPPSVLQLLKVADTEKNLPLLLSTLNEKVIVVSVGPSTTESLERNCISVDVMPKVHKMGPMVSALADYISYYIHKQDQKTKLARVLKNVNLLGSNYGHN